MIFRFYLQRFAEGDPPAGEAVQDKTPPDGTPPADGQAETDKGKDSGEQAAPPKSFFDADDADKKDEAQDKKPDEGDKDKKPDEKPGPPETYDLKLPDESSVDPVLLEKTTTGFKALGLTNEQAQGVMDMLPEYQQMVQATVLTQHQVQIKEWEQQTIAELGKDYKQELAFAAKAVDGYGSKELKELLAVTGMDRHPLINKFVIAIGKDMAEGKIIKGGSGNSPSEKSAAEILYPKK